MSEKAVSDDLEALNLKNFLARRQPWWRLVILGHTLKGMTNIFSLATPLAKPGRNYLKTMSLHHQHSIKHMKRRGTDVQYVMSLFCLHCNELVPRERFKTKSPLI